jgi:hypothetical protein
VEKSELLNALQNKYQEWQGFMDQIGPTRMDQPGVNGDLSVKDIVAHATGWNRWLVIRLQAAARSEPEPPPPWPAQLETEDEINAWIYKSNRGRSRQEVLDETDQVLQQLRAVIQALPEDVRLEAHFQNGRVSPLVWMDNKYYPAAEFFDHFQDDHEPDIRAWLARQEIA